jgi:hypothetical protein
VDSLSEPYYGLSRYEDKIIDKKGGFAGDITTMGEVQIYAREDSTFTKNPHFTKIFI